MSVSDESPFTEPFRLMRYPVHRVHSAYCYRCPVGLKRESCHIECAQQLEILLADRGAQIAAVIVEPLLQGAGGMIVHPAEFLQRVRTLCAAHDVLLLADGAMLRSGGIRENQAHTFYHGHSYTGNALACAAANENLRIFDDEPVFDRISTIARIHGERLDQLREMRQVGDIRQIGAVGALELRTEDAGYLSAMRPKLYQFFLERGVLLRPWAMSSTLCLRM
jgi:adenosylmethionine-8-amino-7-oxononanoate aminotransferase